MRRDLGLSVWAWLHSPSSWYAGHGGDDGWTAVVEALKTWHAGRGTRSAERIAIRQAYIAFAVSEDRAHEEIADRLGCGLRSVERDAATLKLVFGRSSWRRAERRAA